MIVEQPSDVVGNCTRCDRPQVIQDDGHVWADGDKYPMCQFQYSFPCKPLEEPQGSCPECCLTNAHLVSCRKNMREKAASEALQALNDLKGQTP